MYHDSKGALLGHRRQSLDIDTKLSKIDSMEKLLNKISEENEQLRGMVAKNMRKSSHPIQGLTLWNSITVSALIAYLLPGPRRSTS
jgi:hypothetical protein